MSAHVVAQQWVSVDGFAAGPDGEADLFAAVPAQADAASMEHNLRLLPGVQEVLLGRRTYESFAGFWPSADLPVAALVNTLPKTVFSRTVRQAPWGSFAAAHVERDAVTYVQYRREHGDGCLLLWGSVDLQRALLRARLVDELELLVAPVALGAGVPLLPPGLRLDLDLREHETWGPVARLRYGIRHHA